MAVTLTPTPVAPDSFSGNQAADTINGTGTAVDGSIAPRVSVLNGDNATPISSTNPLPAKTLDGADVTQGTLADGTWDESSPATAQTYRKYGSLKLKAIMTALSGGLTVTVNNFPGSQVISGAVSAVLTTGSAIIGKVGIDQTTDGTTNAVHVNNLPATQAISAAALPLPAGAAVETGGNLAAAASVLGTTAGAAVTSDANGTVQQYARGLVKMLASAWVSGSSWFQVAIKSPLDGSGYVQVNVETSALPGGASQDGTDPVGTNAGTQAGSTTPGVGIRGWLSTLVGLFQNGLAKFQGNVASGGADSGNPVKVGGRYNAAFPTLTDGQRGDLQLDSTGGLRAAARTNANRNGGVLHRNGITAADLLGTVGTITLSAVASSTALTATAYYVSAVAGNRWGNALAATIQTITPSATNLIRAAFAQIAGADYYDIFMSTSSTGPLWVGRITETQRASGIIISAVGTTTAGGTAGAVDIKVVGTGLAVNVLPFTIANAYTPATPTPINCAGYSLIHWHIKVALTDLRSLPTLAVVPFLQDQTSSGDWFQCQRVVLNLLTGAGQALCQDITMQLDGATDAVLLFDSPAGQGVSVTAYAELA